MGWRRRSDVDAEMWPEEAFGGVSDEQFWDDLASDKPLATTARTAQPDGAPLPSPASGRPRLPEPGRHGPAAPAGPAGPRHGDQDTTQAFKITGGTAVHTTGPQPAAFPAQSQPIPVRIHPQPAPTHSLPPGQLNRPGTTGPQPVRAATGPQPLPAAQPAQTGQHARPRGRHSADEDPLTSSAYSLRSNGGMDGRSYQASRRTRDTQSFGVIDADSAPPSYPASTPPYGYELPPAPARPGAPGNGNGPAPDPYRQNPYGQGTQTPPYGENYGYGAGPAGQPVGQPAGRGNDRDYGRPAVRPRERTGERPGYPAQADRPRPGYQNGYPGPYDSRGSDRRG